MRYGPGAYRVLAVLLLADGRFVDMYTLATFALPWGGGAARTASHWVTKLRAWGCQIETHTPYGYALRAIPPDGLLEATLTMVDQLRAEYPDQAWMCLGRAIESRAA